MQRIGYVAMTAVLAACGRGTPSGAADTTAAAAPAAAPAPPQAASELASSRTFYSQLSDFQFAVPDVWEQRYTATERANAPEYPRSKTVSEFMFLALSGGTPPTLLTIIQYSQADWKAVSSGSGKPGGTVVSEGRGRVFVALFLPTNPFPAGSDDAVAIAGMMLTPEQVKKAMRVQ
jgi:hypothetical protein